MIDHQNLKIAVWQRDGKYLGFVKELAILEEAASLPDLWEAVSRRKEEICHRLEDEGLTLESITAEMGSTPGRVQPRALFSKTGFIVIAAVLIAAVLALLVVSNGVIGGLRLAKADLFSWVTNEIKIRANPNHLAEKLESLTDDEKEKVHRSLRAINDQLRPFVSDIRPLLSDFSAPAECPPPRGSGVPGRTKR
jgi:hypothetical protein